MDNKFVLLGVCHYLCCLGPCNIHLSVPGEMVCDHQNIFFQALSQVPGIGNQDGSTPRDEWPQYFQEVLLADSWIALMAAAVTIRLVLNCQACTQAKIL